MPDNPTAIEQVERIKGFDLLVPFDGTFNFTGHISLWVLRDGDRDVWLQFMGNIGWKCKYQSLCNIEFYYPEWIIKAHLRPLLGQFHRDIRKLIS